MVRRMINFLTIDIEDYFQVHALSGVIRYEDWPNYECRVERNTHRLLEMLHDSIPNRQTAIPTHSLDNPLTQAVLPSSSSEALLRPPTGPRATFFILGWIAERYPDLVRKIRKEGHEIACHGYAHKLIYEQSKEEFRSDVRKAKVILEDITGSEVIGYRAPGYSIVERSEWAFEILMEEGFRYDSSIFPIRHDFYGMPGAPRFPFLISRNGNGSVSFSGSVDLPFPPMNASTHSLVNSSDGPRSAIRDPQFLIEFPLSTVQLLGMNLPVSGGGYFRLFPYSLVKRGLQRLNEVEKRPFIFYVHPWELDDGQPKIQGLGLRSRFRHYVNLSRTEEKLAKLLGDFDFCTIRDLLPTVRQQA